MDRALYSIRLGGLIRDTCIKAYTCNKQSKLSIFYYVKWIIKKCSVLLTVSKYYCLLMPGHKLSFITPPVSNHYVYGGRIIFYCTICLYFSGDGTWDNNKINAHTVSYLFSLPFRYFVKIIMGINLLNL